MSGRLAGVIASSHVAAGDWTPADLPGVLGWWDASDVSTITKTGTRVDQVDDKSGNGQHLTRGGTDTTEGTLNSRNALLFNGGHFASTIDAASLAMVQFLAIRIPTDTAYILGSTSSSSPFMLSAAASSAASHNGYTSVTLHVNGALAASVTRQNVLDAVGTATRVIRATGTQSSTSTNFSLGYSTGGAFAFSDDTLVGESIVCGPLSGTDITLAENYLTAKWI